MQAAYGIAMRLLNVGEDLVMTHDTQSTRTSSHLVTVDDTGESARELLRAYWRVYQEVFKTLSWEALCPTINPETTKALNALVA